MTDWIRRSSSLIAAVAAACCGVALAGDLPAIVAHRGASHLAPENTMVAVELAWELGADAVECDVHLSRDGQIVLHHDRTMKRTAKVDVAIKHQTWEQLQGLDVGTWKGAEWTGVRMPLLRDVIDTVPEDKRLLIEIKCGPEIVEPLTTLLARSGKRPEQTCVIGFSLDVVRAMKAARPDLEVYWLASFKRDKESGAWSPSIEEIIEKAKSAGVDGVDLQAAEPLLHERAVERVREAGLELHAWTVDDPELAHTLVRLGVDSITTNRPGWLAERLRERIADSNESP